MNVINKITIWPGGKTHADYFINSFGDTIFFIIGYKLSQSLEKFKTK